MKNSKKPLQENVIMQKPLTPLLHAYVRTAYSPQFRWLLQLFFVVALVFMSRHAFAESGADLLQGTDQSLWATLNGTGKKYIYGIEGLVAIAAYIRTKNVMALVGIIVVAIFLNILLAMSGQST